MALWARSREAPSEAQNLGQASFYPRLMTVLTQRAGSPWYLHVFAAKKPLIWATPQRALCTVESRLLIARWLVSLLGKSVGEAHELTIR